MKKNFQFGRLIVIYFLIPLLSYGNESSSAICSSLLENANKILKKESGILKCKPSGYCYLKVDDQYIYSLNKLIQQDKSCSQLKKFTIPPYFRKKDSPGAHISVFYENEWEKNKFSLLKEVGHSYSFRHHDTEIVQNKDKNFLILRILSPDLENLRKHYNKSALLNNHSFHITIAEMIIQ